MALTYRWGHYNLTEVLDIQSDTHVADIIKVKGRKAYYIVFSDMLDAQGEDRFSSEELAKSWVEEKYKTA